MSEIEVLLKRIAALEARVHYLENRTVPYWTGPTPQPYLPLVVPPASDPINPYKVTCTDGLGNVSEFKGTVIGNAGVIAQ